MHTIPDETHLAAREVSVQDSVKLAAQDVQCSHHMLCRCILDDILPHIGGESVQVCVHGCRILPARILWRQFFYVERTEWRCVRLEVERSDGVFLKILSPFFDDFIGRHSELGFILAVFDFLSGER